MHSENGSPKDFPNNRRLHGWGISDIQCVYNDPGIRHFRSGAWRRWKLRLQRAGKKQEGGDEPGDKGKEPILTV